jgi:SAM-dependent methyltransferase
MTRRVVPLLLRAARLAPGQRVLDIATGTGLAAEAAAEAVGPTGHVLAADISPAMVARARERLGGGRTSPSRSRTHRPSPSPTRLRRGALQHGPDVPPRPRARPRRVPPRAPAGGPRRRSVFTRGDRALVGGLVRAAIARRDPVKAAEAAHFYSAGEERRLQGLFEGAGLREVETAGRDAALRYADFDDFFGGVERGEGRHGAGVHGAAGRRAPGHP